MEILTFFAILLSPLIALQVSTWLEVRRERRQRRLDVFKTLMASRAAPTSPAHVQGLNRIDLEFDQKKDAKIVDLWHNYHHHLRIWPQPEGWGDTQRELLATLLQEMGKLLGYSFEKAHIKESSYYPNLYGDIDKFYSLTRGWWKLVQDRGGAIPMYVTNIPSSGQTGIEDGSPQPADQVSEQPVLPDQDDVESSTSKTNVGDE